MRLCSRILGTEPGWRRLVERRTRCLLMATVLNGLGNPELLGTVANLGGADGRCYSGSPIRYANL